jgi:hypothetical protein
MSNPGYTFGVLVPSLVDTMTETQGMAFLSTAMALAGRSGHAA